MSELKQFEKVLHPPLKRTWRLPFSPILPSAYVTCNINLNNNWMLSLPLPPWPLRGVKGPLICFPIVPNTTVGVLKPFNLDTC